MANDHGLYQTHSLLKPPDPTQTIQGPKIKVAGPQPSSHC